MDLDILAELTHELRDFCHRFESVFARRELRQTFDGFILGLLTSSQRKNGWELAHQAGHSTPDAVHRFLNSARWEADELLRHYQHYIMERCGKQGALIFDETGFLKKGAHSAGVQRQYSGTAGRVENCQIGVFAAWLTPGAHFLWDRRLYLPKSWSEDRPRCTKAHVPDSCVHEGKPALARKMFEQALDLGLEPSWVGGDRVYGDDTLLRARVAQQCDYVFAVGADTKVWQQWPELESPQQATARRGGGQGGVFKKMRVAPNQPERQRVDELAKQWEPEAWFEQSAGSGSKGERLYQWAWQPVVEAQGRDYWIVPSRHSLLLVRQRRGDPSQRSYYLCHSAKPVDVQVWIHRAGERWPIEQCFEEGKKHCGLDEYEVRSWHGWHRHVTLSMLAHGFAALQRQNLREQNHVKKPQAPSSQLCSGRL